MYRLVHIVHERFDPSVFVRVRLLYTNWSLYEVIIVWNDITIATSRGFPAELGKHPSNLNTRQENCGTHGNNALESHKLITLNVL